MTTFEVLKLLQHADLTTENSGVYAVITDEANNERVIGGDGTDNNNKNKADAENGNVNGTDAKTTSMPTLQDADIKFAYNPPTWTNNSVTVTITYNQASNHNNVLHLEYSTTGTNRFLE